MAQKPGGRIPNQGNPPQAKGVGKKSKRHDLERRTTPGLSGSDLQQGDVSRLEQSIRTAPIKEQKPARGQGGGPSTPPRKGGAPGSMPGAMEVLSQRGGGTLAPGEQATSSVDSGRWLPLLREISRVPGAGGLLRNAYVSQLSNVIRQPFVPDVYEVDFDALDDVLIEGTDDGAPF